MWWPRQAEAEMDGFRGSKSWTRRQVMGNTPSESRRKERGTSWVWHGAQLTAGPCDGLNALLSPSRNSEPLAKGERSIFILWNPVGSTDYVVCPAVVNTGEAGSRDACCLWFFVRFLSVARIGVIFQEVTYRQWKMVENVKAIMRVQVCSTSSKCWREKSLLNLLIKNQRWSDFQ